MKLNKKVFSNIKWCLVVIVLVGTVSCQGSLFSYRGRSVEPDKRIGLLDGGPHKGSWKTFDLAIDYQYTKKVDTLRLSGVAELSHHYKYNYEILTHFFLNIFFLNNDGRVLESKLILNGGYSDLEAKFPFRRTLEIPKGAVSIAFDYMIGVREEVTHGRREKWPFFLTSEFG